MGSCGAPADLLAHGRASGNYCLDVQLPAPYWHHLSLSFTPAVASIPFSETNRRVLDIESKKVVLDTLHRAATDTVQDAWRVSEELLDASFRDRHR